MAEASMIKSSGGVFSIHGKGLKMTTRLDVAPYLKILEDMGEDVKEIHLGGNTLGVEACEALADIIKTKKNLQVSMLLSELAKEITDLDRFQRLQTLQTSSPAV